MARQGAREITINRNGAAGFLGWVVGAMVYIAVLSAAGALFAQSASQHWALSLTGVVTVQVPAAEQPVDVENTGTRLGAVLEILRATPGIGYLTILDRKISLALLQPWLGQNLVEQIDLPIMIDLRILGSASLDLDGLRQRLQRRAPGTIVDDHGLWLSRIAVLTTTVERGGWLIVLLVGVVAAVSIIYAVLSGLSVNRETIELMHLMGARDGYVARRFQGYVLAVSLPASVIGGSFAIATVIAIAGVLQNPSSGIESGLQLGSLGGLRTLDWVVICAVPFVFVALTIITARVAALVTLQRMT
jgi:cell division transport system permease protein